MKFCTKCGAEVAEDATICLSCGVPIEQATAQQPVAPAPVSGITTAAKIFMILGTIATGLSLYLIPLAWCIPMTVIYFKKLKNNEPIGTGFKVCSLIFVSLIGGILMLCDKEH